MRALAVGSVALACLLFAVACSDSSHDADMGKPSATVSRPKTTRGKGKQSSAVDAGGDEPASSGDGQPSDSGVDIHHDAGETTVPIDRDAGHVHTTHDAAMMPDDTVDTDDEAGGGVTPPPITVNIDYNGDFPPADKLPQAKGECPVFVTGVQ